MNVWGSGFIIIINYASAIGGGSPLPPGVYSMITEDGDHMITESGNRMITEE